MTKKIKADLALFIVTMGWGASFFLTKSSLAHLNTFNFLAIRFFVAFIISSLIFIKQMLCIDKATLKYGLLIGLVLYATFALQTLGLNYTTASKSAFITGINVMLVPLLSTILLKKAPNKKTILSVIIAFIGLGLLTINKNIQGINIGDFYTFICAIACAFHILLTGKYTKKTNSIAFAVVQIGVCAVLSLITSLVYEQPVLPTDFNIWRNIFILSVVCTSGAYIVQSVAQRYTSATHTALIYTTEPVFAAVFAYIFLHEVLSIKGYVGALLIVSGMLFTEINFKKIFNNKKNVSVAD
ncbi:DMT family transporter [Clostridium sp. 'deep sea']|uniref:DMT family transporter n=1 Tax=Clostridium sp. 'deep sea' TaxID=2779445 RepID=UPI0018967E46|nr:DMT family transporter [Clostridium sp. 'deep sea']QOR36247.1 DMT family transporter [Clostridium sp. 'deep sea']